MGVSALSARAVFLDRDGVLNRTDVRDGRPRPPSSTADVEILPGVVEALQRFAARRLRLIVVTNQPDVSRGAQTRATVEAINRQLMEMLPLDAIFTCFHDEEDGCACRKPRPGLLHAAAMAHGIDLRRSFLIGDRWSDILAGKAAGCTTFLIAFPYSERERCAPDYEVDDLAEAAQEIFGLIGSAEED